MTINVVVSKNYIPVDILGEEYKFYRTDEKIAVFEQGVKDITKRIEKINTPENKAKSLEDQVEIAKSVLVDAYDFIFPEQDSFDKLYKEIQSVTIMVNVFEQVLDGLVDELEKEDKRISKKRLQKYTKHKVKK